MAELIRQLVAAYSKGNWTRFSNNYLNKAFENSYKSNLKIVRNVKILVRIFKISQFKIKICHKYEQKIKFNVTLP